MILYLIRPVERLEDNPWDPWYDKCFGFVICAENEEQARKIADENAGEENWDQNWDQNKMMISHPWLDSEFSTCIELIPGNKEKIVMSDVKMA